MALELRPYQIIGRDFLAARKRALLGDQMRVGKTPQAILAAHKIAAQRTLVVCPAIGVDHWLREWEKWAGVRAIPYAGEAVKAHGPLHLVTSYDTARRHVDKFNDARWDVLIPDESHYAKNPLAARTMMVYGKNGLGWRSDYIWSLSGTPAPNHAGELWPIMSAYGIVKLNYDQFIRAYCNVDWVSGKVFGTKKSKIPELRALLGKFMLRRTRREIAPDMPEIDFQFLEVQPDFDHVHMALNTEDARRDLRFLAERLGKVPVNERAGKLEGMAGDFALARQFCALAKTQPLVEHIDFALSNRLLERTVVFGHYILPLLQVQAKLASQGYKVGLINGQTSEKNRQRIVREFRTGALHVICANILAAGTTIDLSTASHGYFLELDWVPGNNAQAASRLISMDKKEPVTMDVVTWIGSPDETVQTSLTRKASELSLLY